MPKLTEVLCNVRTCRRKNLNQRPVRPIFRQLLPMELKDKVRGTRESSTDACMEEMQSVMSCWNKHEFESAPCKQEIERFQKCFTTMQAKMKEKKSLDAKGLIASEGYNLTRKQVNTLLANNPQHRHKDKSTIYYSNRSQFD